MTHLTEAAITALINVGTNRQGAIIPPNSLPSVLRELKVAGYIKGYGLTRTGTIARERIVNAALEAAF